MNFSQKLYGSQDCLELVCHKDNQPEVSLSNLLMVYSKDGIISGQYPISLSKAEICESDQCTQVRILSIRKDNNKYLLNHTWNLEGRVGEKLLRFFTQIGMTATTFGEKKKWNIDGIILLLASNEQVYLHTNNDSLSVINEFTHSVVNFDDVGVNIMHQGENVKLELWYLNGDGLYAGWFINKAEYLRLVELFRGLGFRISNPDPMNYMKAH